MTNLNSQRWTVRKSIAAMALISLTTLIASCQSVNKKPALPESPKPLGPPLTVMPAKPASGEAKASVALAARQLTASGENSDPRFSVDGKRLIFISRSRSSHKKAQIYQATYQFHDILNDADALILDEKRLTYHDGDDFAPVFDRDGTSFVFASTTDEIKEEPYVSERLLKIYNPDSYARRVKDRGYELVEGSEIYRQSLDGRRITRLTQSLGLDTEPDIAPNSSEIVFSSTSKGKMARLTILRNGKISILTMDQSTDRWPRYSPDGRSLVWSRHKGLKDDSSLLMIAERSFQKPRLLLGPSSSVQKAEVNSHPSWHPSGEVVIFSSNRGGPTYELYTIDRAGTCVKQLTNSSGFDKSQPVFHPDGRQIVFTGRRGDMLHLYAMPYQPPANCTETIETSRTTGPSTSP